MATPSRRPTLLKTLLTRNTEVGNGDVLTTRFAKASQLVDGKAASDSVVQRRRMTRVDSD